MKIQYLGTAAAEGIPAVFCNCEPCNTARLSGGRNIRTRSQMLINDDLLIDLPADTYFHSLSGGMRLDIVKYLLITHSHTDHFYADELGMRGAAFAHGIREPQLTVLSNDEVVKRLISNSAGFAAAVRNGINITAVQTYKTYALGDYRVIPLPANHLQSEQALIYIISKGGKTLLYGNDTGFPSDGVFEFIEKEGVKLDVLSLDCTMVNNPVSDSGTHMGFDGCARTLDRLKKIGAVKAGCRTVVTHFSHNGGLSHGEMVEQAKKYGMEAAYDNFTLTA